MKQNVTSVIAAVLVVAPYAFGAEDAGVTAPDAGASDVTLGFDVVQTPWGPGRKSSGEGFRSTSVMLADGPLRWRWADFGVAVGAQYLVRGELRDNADFDTGANDHTLGIEHRARLSVRGSAKERVGLLLELQDVRGWGTEVNTTTLSASTGLHQGFVDLHAASRFDVRVGRQELTYGEDRLIGSLDWSMTARAFDGVFFRLTASPAVTLDGFGMLLKPPQWLTSDATGGRFHNSGSYFTGLYLRARFGSFGFDGYGLGLLEDVSTAATGARGDSNRATLGVRGFANLAVVSLVAEGAFQTGRVGAAQELLLAGAFAAKATAALPVWGKPYAMLEVSGASGDGTPGNGSDNTFHQLFPTAHVHLGFMDYVAWQNVVAVRGTVGVRPWGAHIWLDVHHFLAWDPRGAWFAANGSVLLAADPMRTNGAMGTELDLSVTVPVLSFVSLAGAFAVFIPANEAATRGQSPSTWGFLSMRSQL